MEHEENEVKDDEEELKKIELTPEDLEAAEFGRYWIWRDFFEAPTKTEIYQNQE